MKMYELENLLRQLKAYLDQINYIEEIFEHGADNHIYTFELLVNNKIPLLHKAFTLEEQKELLKKELEFLKQQIAFTKGLITQELAK